MPSSRSKRLSSSYLTMYGRHVFLELLLWSHIHNLQWSIHQLHDMPRLERFSIYIIHIMRMENAWLGAIQNCLFARRISEAETAPTTYTYQHTISNTTSQSSEHT